MVRIPDRPYAYLASNLPDAGAAAGAAMARQSGAAEMLHVIGEGAGKLFGAALLIQEQRDHDLMVEAQNQYTKRMTEYGLTAEQQRTGDRARGFTRDYAGESDTTRADVAQWLKDNGGSGMAERAFGNWATGRKTVGGADAARFEHGQLLAHSKDLFTQRIQGITDQLEQNPRAFGDAAGQMEEAFTMAVGQGIFRPEEARARLHDAREKLGLTAFDNLYAMDRGQAMQSMSAFGMSPAQQAKARKRLQADQRAEAAQARQARVEQKAEIAADLPDIDYLASQTGDVSGLKDAAAKLRKLGDAKVAERLERKAGLYESNFAAIKESQAMPMSDLLTAVGELEKKITGLQGQGSSGDSENTARELLKLNGEMEIRKKVYADRLQKITHDPAAVALYNDKGLTEQMAGQVTEGAVTKLMAKQSAIGQGVPGFAPQPMTKAQADTLNKQWFAETDAGKQVAMLAGLRQSYGKHLTQVVTQAKLPPAIAAIAPIMDSLSPQETTRMILAAQAKSEDLPRSDDNVKSAIENSEFLQAAQAVSQTMFRSAEQRDFAARTAKAWKNYARAGGDIRELEKNFLIINEGNLRIVAPRAVDAPGLEAGLAAATDQLLNSVGKGKDSFSLRTVYNNGHWTYDGAGGFAFIDAATGLAVARKSRDEILNAGASAMNTERHLS